MGILMNALSREKMREWLCEKDPQKLENLYRQAREEKLRWIGSKVYFRGLIEFSNFCSKNCHYCGIRRDHDILKRYSMSEEEILECAQMAYAMDYGSIVLQSGERQDDSFILFIEKIIQKVKDLTSQQLGITLSLGEQRAETYERWFHAGAHRYLLRMETSSRELYRKLHPADHSFDARLNCLKTLRRIGYQVGTGVMIGLPFQTEDDLVDDIFFFKEEDVDMIGMGPYIPHANTPLTWPDGDYNAADHFRLGLVMIALTRLVLQDVNIAAATALQTLNPKGRERGVCAGANIIMPNITPTTYRSLYKLYDNKPCLDENADLCKSCLEKRLAHDGIQIGYGEWGDSPHFSKRQKTT
ncbi:MAG TPA: [FeFe] hydrogenase H-cluster radical SAM maturase HydE [Candidatus Omnitrophota bacterium]|nr:[FeFe] hydrogenase H-cluster radical SAM maturase HydE [Candidatus Omnitrophota bacterium]